MQDSLDDQKLKLNYQLMPTDIQGNSLNMDECVTLLNVAIKITAISVDLIF